MSDEISPELFARLVDLGAFNFDPDEAEYLRRELNNQLKAIKQLESVKLDGDVLLAAHGVSYTAETSPPLRADEWQPCENPDDILAQAPQVEQRYLIVPDIPHTELD